MKHSFIKYIIAVALGLAMVLPAKAATVVKAHIDSTVLMMGKVATLQLVVEEPQNAKGYFTLFRQLPEKGYVSVCGDSVEMRMPQIADSMSQGRNRKILYVVPVQAFDSGAYVLPPFDYVTGGDTVRSNQVSFKVVPVNVNADDPINDYAGTADPENPSFWDWVPDWVLDYWWVIILALLAIGAFIYAMRRYRREGSLLPKKPEPTPYEEAMANLRKLKEQKLWEQGMEKEYFTELTDILRRYLYRRFGINAQEMTSRQIMSSLSKNEETKQKRSYFRKILDMADFVKFAKVRPLPDDNVAAYDNAVKFVEETKPVEPTPEEIEAAKVRAEAAKKNNKRKKGGSK